MQRDRYRRWIPTEEERTMTIEKAREERRNFYVEESKEYGTFSIASAEASPTRRILSQSTERRRGVAEPSFCRGANTVFESNRNRMARSTRFQPWRGPQMDFPRIGACWRPVVLRQFLQGIYDDSETSVEHAKATWRAATCSPWLSTLSTGGLRQLSCHRNLTNHGSCKDAPVHVPTTSLLLRHPCVSPSRQWQSLLDY